ncbi:MAG: dihydrodipicolinate synthase family protein [Gemmatimonadetes bacterium]|nr:dihydrodipicolinate synthase family protein [Gemmatimonadota bacterium]
MGNSERRSHGGSALRTHLLAGQVIPAHPLALTAERTLDERRQRALTRYYLEAGAGGLAVGVHTTQFAIRDPRHGLFEPVLALAAETIHAELHARPRSFVAIAGVVGHAAQALREATLAAELGYDALLLSLAAWRDASEEAMLAHCRAVATVRPLVGFYLQPAVGGRVLSYGFWRRFAEIPEVVAIKIAPFNRYQTLDVVRAVADAGRDDIALCTGNDDSIVVDLLSRFRGPHGTERRIVGGLLGQWAVGTRRAVEMLHTIRRLPDEAAVDPAWFRLATALTELNAALFDAANGFHGCIAGIHEALHRQGLLAGTWCLDPGEGLSPGQAEEIERALAAHPDLLDDRFIAEHRDRWLTA